MRVYSYSLQGKRATQEDQHFSFINLNNTNIEYNPINLFGVFDGHGGSRVSKYLKSNLPDFFLIKLKNNIYKNKKDFINYVNEIYNLQIQINKCEDINNKNMTLCGNSYIIKDIYTQIVEQKNFE